MRTFFRRSPPEDCRLCALKAAIGGLVAIALVAVMAEMVGSLAPIAPLAASCVLVFAAPASPMAQPANVIGGHMLSTSVALAMDAVLPGGWWTVALGVGVAIWLMAVTRLTHPPAGADALVVLTVHPGLDYLFFPVLAGSVTMVAVGVAVHRLMPPRGSYPAPAPEPAE